MADYQTRSVERLTEILQSESTGPRSWQHEAANTIQRQRAEIEKWFSRACEEKALRTVAEATVEAMRCNCGASAGGTKWSGVHTEGCAALTAGKRTEENNVS